MQRRILLIVLVFVAGFAVGYGLTWLFVGSPKRTSTSPQQASVPPAAPDVVQANAPDVSGPPDASTPVDGAATLADAPSGEVALPPDVQAAGAAAPDAGPGLVDVPPAPEVVPEAPKAAWEQCLNKVCRLDFGGVNGAISIRRGKFDHGADIDWEKDFGRAEKIGSLDSDKTVRLEVLAIGLSNGEPTAAYVSRKLKKSTQEGVIALRIGDKRLSLVPLEE